MTECVFCYRPLVWNGWLWTNPPDSEGNNAGTLCWQNPYGDHHEPNRERPTDGT